MSDLTLSTVDPHIYLSGELLVDTLDTFSRSLRTTKTALVAAATLNESKPQPILLHISSYGGDLLAAYGVADLIESLDYPVYSIVEGVAASAATLVSIACKKRYILPNSFMMVHEFSSIMWGTHSDFMNEVSFQKRLMKQFIKFYVDRTKLTKKELQVRLKKDWWLSAKDAIKWGLVDGYYH